MITTVDKPTDTEKTLHAAKESSESLKQQLSENMQKQQSIQDELDSIQHKRQKLVHSLSEAHAYVASFDSTHSKAIIEAKLAQGTAKEHVTAKAVHDIQIDLHAAKKALAQAEKEVTEQETAASAREQELIGLLSQLQAEQSRLQTEQSHTLNIARIAHEEAGNEKHAAILAELPRINAEEDEIRSQLLAKQVEKHGFFEKSVQSLEGWPELQREVSLLQPKDDAVSILALSALFYLEAILKEGPELKNQAGRIRVPIAAGTLENLFAIPSEAIAQAANGMPQALIMRIGHLKQVLGK
jgi:chromosome segregation ATPase